MPRRLVRIDNSAAQKWRHAVQLFFLGLNIWIGIEFYWFVRQCERGLTITVTRPPAIEGWLPIASLMNLKLWIESGAVPRIHPAGMFLLIAFLTISLLMRKAFCGWICPVGTVSDYLWRTGRSTFNRNLRPPKCLDLPLRSLKYILLALFGYAVGSMSGPSLQAFMESPYGMVADVKMLNFFRFLGVTGAVLLGSIILASIFIQNFWCRYLCPYGALMGLIALTSPLRIRRDTAACIDCGKCARACPAMLPVDKLVQIRSAECLGCMDCIAVCPAAGALQLSLPRRRAVPAWKIAAAVGVIFIGTYAFARLSGYWRTDVPLKVYYELVPIAAELSHP